MSGPPIVTRPRRATAPGALPGERAAEFCATACPLPTLCGGQATCYVLADARQRGDALDIHRGAAVHQLDDARARRAVTRATPTTTGDLP